MSVVATVAPFSGLLPALRPTADVRALDNADLEVAAPDNFPLDSGPATLLDIRRLRVTAVQRQRQFGTWHEVGDHGGTDIEPSPTWLALQRLSI